MGRADDSDLATAVVVCKLFLISARFWPQHPNVSSLLCFDNWLNHNWFLTEAF
jgi:hypothetical protein